MWDLCPAREKSGTFCSARIAVLGRDSELLGFELLRFVSNNPFSPFCGVSFGTFLRKKKSTCIKECRFCGIDFLLFISIVIYSRRLNFYYKRLDCSILHFIYIDFWEKNGTFRERFGTFLGEKRNFFRRDPELSSIPGEKFGTFLKGQKGRKSIWSDFVS